MEIYNGTYCVYVHTNKINGKKYVGQTCRIPKKRWANGYGYKNNKYFNNAISKYGWDNFEHKIIASNLTKDEANNFEILLIEKLDTTNRNKGYNITKGGEGARGRHTTEETKQKISESKIGVYGGKNHPRAKKVAQYDLDGNLIRIWDYIKQASDELHINQTDISRCCKGFHFSVGGFVWRYIEDINDIPSKIELNKPKGKYKKIPVICVETNTIYQSMSEAKKQTGCDTHGISKCCNGERETCGGYHWKFL